MLDGSGTDVLMATQNATYYAKYVIDSTKYTITATAGSNGMISPSGAIKIKEGESQKFTIIANDGYHIANIFVDGQLIEVSNEYEFKNVSCNHSISVQFKKNDFKATINSDDKFGIVSGAEWFENGERAVFKIVTKDGIKIKAVKVNGKNVSVSNNSFVIESVSSNLDIVVEYEYENSLKNIDLKYVIIGAVVIVVLTSVIIVLIKKKRKAKVDA